MTDEQDLRKLFTGHYVNWREKRIAKIESIFGREFFRGKSLLELACGFGHTGKYFREELGALVSFAEVDARFLPIIQERNPGADIYGLNQEGRWQLPRRFEVIIHFGVSYHLVNWRQDLQSTMAHTDLIIFETEITNSLKPDRVRVFEELKLFDQGVHPSGMGTRPSSACMEAEIVKNGWSFTRYDDADLN